MAFPDFDAVVTKVYDLLRADARTRDLDWYNGSRLTTQVQQFPAGNVELGQFSVLPFTIPGGDEAPFRVLVQLWYTHQEGGTKLAQLLRKGIRDVAMVLVDTARLTGSGGWDIGLSDVELIGIAGRIVVAPEHTSPLAAAMIEVQVRAINA